MAVGFTGKGCLAGDQVPAGEGEEMEGRFAWSSSLPRKTQECDDRLLLQLEAGTSRPGNGHADEEVQVVWGK